jgi:hypothetical protein
VSALSYSPCPAVYFLPRPSLPPSYTHRPRCRSPHVGGGFSDNFLIPHFGIIWEILKTYSQLYKLPPRSHVYPFHPPRPQTSHEKRPWSAAALRRAVTLHLLCVPYICVPYTYLAYPISAYPTPTLRTLYLRTLHLCTPCRASPAQLRQHLRCTRPPPRRPADPYDSLRLLLHLPDSTL